MAEDMPIAVIFSKEHPAEAQAKMRAALYVCPLPGRAEVSVFHMWLVVMGQPRSSDFRDTSATSSIADVP
jgi:hypothetical protein